jgi:hypothetical protein
MKEINSIHNEDSHVKTSNTSEFLAEYAFEENAIEAGVSTYIANALQINLFLQLNRIQNSCIAHIAISV